MEFTKGPLQNPRRNLKRTNCKKINQHVIHGPQSRHINSCAIPDNNYTLHVGVFKVIVTSALIVVLLLCRCNTTCCRPTLPGVAMVVLWVKYIVTCLATILCWCCQSRHSRGTNCCRLTPGSRVNTALWVDNGFVGKCMATINIFASWESTIWGKLSIRMKCRNLYEILHHSTSLFVRWEPALWTLKSVARASCRLILLLATAQTAGYNYPLLY